MSTSSSGFDLEQVRTQAKELLKLACADDNEALLRIARHHPEQSALLTAGKLRLSDCQLVAARERGYDTWAQLKQNLLYRSAVSALDTGNIPALTGLLEKYPALVRNRCRHGDWYESGYFKGAMLLHHVAGNPIRCPIPANVLDVTRILLYHGADPNAITEGGSSTIGLLLTSRQASESGMALPLIELLTSAGARDNPQDPDRLTLPLLQAAPETAAALAERGANIDMRHAAGLGRLDLLDALLERDPNSALRDVALVFAAIRGQEQATELLLRHGARGDILLGPAGMTLRTALHEAANRGHRNIVMLLLDAGADPSVNEPRWGGTPGDWARHGNPVHSEIAELLDRRVEMRNRQ